MTSQYFDWGGSIEFPYKPVTFERWRRGLQRRDVRFVVLVRSPAEEPERGWMMSRPSAFRMEYWDAETEIWRVIPETERRERRRETREARPARSARRDEA
jgi:hypothetical protein